MKVINNNRGAALVFAALFLTVMFLFIGIAIDIGWMTYVKNQGQAAVDSAALAGASALPDQVEVYSRVTAFNGRNTVIDSEQNHLDSSNVTFFTYDGTDLTAASDPASANGVRVAMEGESDSAIQTPFFFSVWRRFFGGTASGSANVNVSATAVVPNKPSLPIALLGCEPGAQDFELDQVSDPEDDSAFTSFTIESASANDFKNMVNDPDTYIPPVEPNDTCIYLNNGQVNSALKEIKQKYSPYTPSPCFFVPVFDDKDIKPNQCRVFQRFAKICITDVVDQKSPKYIEANVESCDADRWQTPVTAAGRPVLIK